MNFRRLNDEAAVVLHLDVLAKRLDLDKDVCGGAGAQSLRERVAEIVTSVQQEKDKAVRRWLSQIDQVDLGSRSLEVSREEIASASASVPAEIDGALRLMAARIKKYAESMLPRRQAWSVQAEDLRLGYRYTPIESIGAYVPGGLAGSTPLISTVLMNLIPARVAGVRRIVVATPCRPDGTIHPCLLHACSLAGATDILRAGGAHGVAALAFGSSTRPPCVKIVGPGNRYVQEAKRQLFGRVDIDMMAGPSEIAILADAEADPAWLAADMIAQAEHDPMAAAVLFSPSEALNHQVAAELERQLEDLPRADIARASLRDYGALCRCTDLKQGIAWINRMAPEHLEVVTREPEAWLEHIEHAGAIFLGAHSPEVVGDYVAGPSHTLPTCGAARFSSGITVHTFLKSTSLIEMHPKGLVRDLEHIVHIARAENLEGHARSALRRGMS